MLRLSDKVIESLGGNVVEEIEDFSLTAVERSSFWLQREGLVFWIFWELETGEGGGGVLNWVEEDFLALWWVKVRKGLFL